MMRRAISPAICLNTTRVSCPSNTPSTVIMFCSFECAGVFLTGHQELALLISHAGDFPGDGRAIHVHIEDIQEDADAVPPGVVSA